MPLKLYEKKKILDACFDVFVRYGYAGATTAMLAEAAGISKALIFHHFQSKKTLYLNILHRCFEDMAPFVNEKNMDSYSDFFEARGQSGFLRIDYLKDNPKVAKILLEAFYNTPDELKEDIDSFSAHMASENGKKQDMRSLKLKQLFDEIPLRQGIDREDAFEFVEIIMQHFNYKHLYKMVEEGKLMDDTFWAEFRKKKSKFLEMLRYGIEKQDK